jgi:hypothetical protein
MGYAARNAAHEIDSLFRELLPQVADAEVLPLPKVKLAVGGGPATVTTE